MDVWNSTSLLSDVGALLLSPPVLPAKLPGLFSSAALDSLDMNSNLLLGISISLLTNFIQSMGLTIQRKSHVLNENHPVDRRKGSCQRPLWIVGFVTYLAANITGSVFSIGYLPIVILAPLGAVGLVFNAFFARILLGDPFTRQTFVGTIFIIIGAVLMGLFGVVPEPQHSLDDLIQLWLKPAFVVYFSIVEIIIIIALIITHVTERKLSQAQRGIIKENDPYFRGWRLAKVKQAVGISYGVNSGMISSQSLLFAKSGIELLLLTIIDGKNQFDRFLTWVLVLFLAVTAILQLYYLNKGLRFCDTVLLIPISFCTFNVSCLFNGLVYYDQWSRLHWYQILLVIIGVLFIILGVLVLSWRSSGPTGPEEEFLNADMGVEEAMGFGSPPQEHYDLDFETGNEQHEMDEGEGSSSSHTRYHDNNAVPEPTEKTRLLGSRKGTRRLSRSGRGNDEFYGI